MQSVQTSLHLALLFRRLRSEAPEIREFSQAVFDLFFKDMDRSLREMGAGDLAVPKKIRKMGGLFYGLLQSVAEALDKADAEELGTVLERNVYLDASPARATDLAAYLMRESERLAGQPADAIVSGQIASGEAA